MLVLTFDQKIKLVDKLLDCPHLANFAERKSVVEQLPKHIKTNIALGSRNNDKSEVLAIVDTCLGFDNGLFDLLKVLSWFDKDTIAFQALVSFLETTLKVKFLNDKWQVATVAAAEPTHPANKATPKNRGRAKTNQQGKRAELQKLCSDHTAFIKDRLSSFVGRTKELAEIEMLISEKLETGGYVTITGQAGQGKSSVIARLVQTRLDQTHEQNPEQSDLLAYHFIPFNPGPDHQVALLRNLMTRLILKHGLLEIYIASDNRATLRDMFPNVLRDIVAEGKQEVIFIDGLDQLEPENSGKRDLSFLPTNPPSGIVFVLGTRPDDTLRPLELLKPKDEYKLPELSRADFDLVLECRGVRLSRYLANRFYEAMQKNALYLDLVAQELRLSENDSSPETVIRKLANNPNNLFELAIERFMLNKQEWLTVIKPIIGVLITAQEPLPLFSLKQLLMLEISELNSAVQKLGGLLAQDGQGKYYLYHLKLIEYMLPDESQPTKLPIYDQEFLSQLHAEFAQWCENSKGGLAAIWENKPNDTIENYKRGYARQHYITHLYQSQNWSKLFSVLNSGEYGKYKVRYYDISAQAYAQDLDLGRTACSRKDLELKEGLQLISNLWRYTLLRGSLASRVDNYPVELFEHLYLAGRTKECLGKVELITNPEHKVSTLVSLGSLILERAGQVSVTEVEILYIQALTLAEKNASSPIISILAKYPEIIVSLGLPEKLLKILDSTENKDEILQTIAIAQAQAGLFDQAIATAKSIIYAKKKAGVLQTIAIAQAQVGLFDQAMATSKFTTDKEGKNDIFHAIAQTQAQAGLFDQAMATSKFIIYEWKKAGVLQAIAIAQAQAGLFDQAMATSKSIIYERKKTETLLTIATIQIQAGLPSEAFNTVQLALNTAYTITDKEWKAETLQTIAVAQAQAGWIDEAIVTFQSALSITDSIIDERKKAAILLIIATSLAQVGLPNKAITTFQLALSVAAYCADKWRKAAMLRAIAIAQKKIRLFDEAIATANSITDGEWKATTLCSIAVAQTQSGLLDKAIATFQSALSAANSINSVKSKAEALQTIAVAQAQSGLLDKAIATANSTAGDEYKVISLRAVVMSQLYTGLFDEAIATTNSITNKSTKMEVLQTIARAQAQAGLSDQAFVTFQRIINIANSITDSDKGEKDNIFRAIVVAQASSGLLDQAIATANSITDSNKSAKDDVLCSIATAQIQAGLFDEAIATTNSITNENMKDHVLSALIKTQTQTDQVFVAPEQILSITDSLINEKWKAEVLQAITIAQARFGLSDDIIANFQLALNKTDSLINEEWKAEVLQAIAIAQAQAGLSEAFSKAEIFRAMAMVQAQVELTNEATATFRLALNAADYINSQVSKTIILRSIAISQIHVNLYDEAIATANLIADDWKKTEVLQTIATAQAQAGLFDQAFGTFQQALAVAGKHNISVLRTIAITQAQAKLFDEAIATANSITDARRKASVLCAIAITQAQAKLFDEAIATFQLTLSIAHSNNMDEVWKADVLRAVTTAQIEVGLYDEAIATATSFTDEGWKIKIFRTIAAAQAQIGQCDEAITTANAITDEVSRVEALENICLNLVKKQKYGEALELTHKAWKHISNREQALLYLQIALPLLQSYSELGKGLIEAFEWVDDFLRHC